MADTNNLNEADLKTRSNLAYIWSIALIAIIGFTLYEYGHILAVLTLLIGFATGTVNTILAVYFGSAIAGKKQEPTVQQTGDSPIVNVTPTQDKVVE